MTTSPSNNSARNTTRRQARLVLIRFATAALGFAVLWAVSVAARRILPTHAFWEQVFGKIAHPEPAIILTQDDDASSSSPGASPEEIGRYVAVYRAMQRNHRLTIGQAAAAQGFTVAAFRELEQRIERNSMSRDNARRLLAEPEPSETATAAPPPNMRR